MEQQSILDRMVLAVQRVREPLVRMKLTSFRSKDRVHVRDMIEVGLIDGSWPSRFPNELSARLQEIISDPEG